MPPSKPRQINEKHARIAGDVISSVGEQLSRGADELRQRALEGAPDYLYLRSANVRYSMQIETFADGDDKKTTRVSQVDIEADLGVAKADDALQAPFALLAGTIGPAEKRRVEIEAALAKKVGISAGHPPIFGVGPSKYWVKAPGYPHAVVEFRDSGEVAVRVIKTLDELDKEVEGFFTFLAGRLKSIYGE